MSDSTSHRIAVIHGPNLNLLGHREPEIYGTETLANIDEKLTILGREKGFRVDCYQSNHEGNIIDHLHGLRGNVGAIVINPGGLTHTSVALRDALTAMDLPIYEVHLSNIHQREEFRHRSFISGIAAGVICGLGSKGYEYALTSAMEVLLDRQ